MKLLSMIELYRTDCVYRQLSKGSIENYIKHDRLYNVYIVYDLLVSNIEKAICWIKTVTACEKSADKVQ